MSAESPKPPPLAAPAREPAGGTETSRGGNLRAEMLARMGHELRTPLNAIIGFIKLVEEGLYTNEEERRDYLASARQSALTLLDLINNILDLARLEAGRLTLESVELSVADLIEEVTKTLAPEAHAKGVDIEAFVDPAIPARLKSDLMRLRQVLYNLTGNAVKFTDAGLVLVRAELEENGRETSRVRFAVRDTGIGVPEEQQPLIFESFVQTQMPRSDRTGGVGLGLSIAKQIVEQMGGTIALQSRVNEGSTFSFALDLPRGRTYGSRPRGRPGTLAGARLLLVNPDAGTRELYRDKLAALGAQADAVASSEAALALLAGAQAGAAPIRAVLLDHHLGRDETLVFARRVRRETAWYQPDLVQLAVIGATGDTAPLREAGISAFVTKPAFPSALRGVLAALLERQGVHGFELQGPAAKSEAVPARRGRPRSAQVLVAEDNAVNQKLIQALLSKHGYGTRLVANGREAVEVLRNERFDLVLMDVQMPVLDGLAATRAIRQLPECRALPIIAMTADALDGDRERCLAAGMDDYLPKPIMPDLLSRKLCQWLQPAPPEEGRASAAIGPGESEAVLDGVHLESVRAYAGDHDPRRFAAWVALFRAEAEAALALLEGEETRRDPAALRAAAQRLALACAGFGAPRLLALARQLGEAGGAGPATALAERVAALRAAYRGVEAALAVRFETPAAGSPTA